MPTPITYYDRYSGSLVEEAVYGEGFLRWAYETTGGKIALSTFVSRPWFSKWYGWRMNKAASRSKVAPFISDFEVNADDFLDSADSYRSFNEFFYRKLKPIARPIKGSDNDAVFPADGRHLCLPDVTDADAFFVKGQRFDLVNLLGSEELASEFEHGSLLLSRLCPTDYHRFHFPVAGEAGKTMELNSNRLFSVSPIALRKRLAYMWENKRTLCIVDSPQFGRVAVLEIGATCVGSIFQTYTPGTIAKGDEKGYFAFGGSSVITIYKKGAIQFSDDLIEQSAQQTEVYAHVGDICGTAAL